MTTISHRAHPREARPFSIPLRAGALLLALLSAGPLTGAETPDAAKTAPPKPKITAAWAFEKLGAEASSDLKRAVLDALMRSDELAPLDNATLIFFKDEPKLEEKEKEALKKEIEAQLWLALRIVRESAPPVETPVLKLSERDIHAEPRARYELKEVRPATDKDGKAQKPDYDWVRANPDPSEPPLDDTGKPADLAAWEAEHSKNHRISVAARAGYEVTHLPDVNGEDKDDGGAFFGIRYYSENLFRFGSPATLFRDDDPQKVENKKPYFRPNRVGEVDMFIDLNYRSADIDKDKDADTGKPLESVSAVNFTGGFYMPLHSNFPRAVLFDFTDQNPTRPESAARGEFGLIAAGGIKATIGDEAANDFQKFGAAGVRMATFRPTSPDPIRYIDLLLGGRTDFHNPRLRIESHFLLYEFERGKTPSESSVNLYAFGAAEIDLKKDDANAQDALIFGVYLRYELDRLKAVFGSLLP